MSFRICAISSSVLLNSEALSEIESNQQQSVINSNSLRRSRTPDSPTHFLTATPQVSMPSKYAFLKILLLGALKEI